MLALHVERRRKVREDAAVLGVVVGLTAVRSLPADVVRVPLHQPPLPEEHVGHGGRVLGREERRVRHGRRVVVRLVDSDCMAFVGVPL